ncbi:FAD:protein FMN transferase [Haliscomenobacter sp.]|uniref:FAD:protein FMN transferase n=1 Tax=Haliscomenobacter sp. TaxID=2717303 RepID=UPI0035931426
MRTTLLFAIMLLFFACNNPQQKKEQDTGYRTIEGQTMGTYYRISYQDSLDRDIQTEIEKSLAELNGELSTYDSTTLISDFNQSTAIQFNVPMRARHFLANLNKSAQVYRSSDGAFDPTVAPLVNYWGFGYTGSKPITEVDSTKIKESLNLVGMSKLNWTTRGDSVLIHKQLPGIKLDFNAIAPGYAVDELGRVLEAERIYNYLIDIGGEVLAKGQNPQGKDWVLGITIPKEGAESSEIQTTVPLHDQALATSGNYRKYYSVKGEKYSHTINPKTGFPERSKLLSATVIAPDAMTADAYATVCMVLGLEKGLALIESLPNLEAYFIYGDPKGAMLVKYTSKFKDER